MIKWLVVLFFGRRLTWRQRYERVLRSRRWKQLRRRIYYGRAHKACEGCRQRMPLGALDLNHWTYKRLGRERKRDVQLLCRTRCHPWADQMRREWGARSWPEAVRIARRWAA